MSLLIYYESESEYMTCPCRCLAERSEQGEHESKVVRYVEVLGKKISEAPG